jgi:hypothetical protein
MRFNPKSDLTQASLTLYNILALNAETESGGTIHKTEAARVLARLLQINPRAPESWLRGDFKKHPMSRENFLRFVRAYRTRRELETPKEIRALAVNLYGSDYKRVLELLDPVDRDVDWAQEIGTKLPGKARVVAAIRDLLESDPEALEIALGAMNTHSWTADVLLEKLQEFPAAETGLDKIMAVIVSQFPENLREAFSKLGGLSRLAHYNLYSFETLWEKTGQELAGRVALFEKLNLIRAVQADEWKIKPQVLEIARRYLLEFPETIQMRAQRWRRRLMDHPRYLAVFRRYLYSKCAEVERLTGGIQKRGETLGHKPASFAMRLSGWFFIRLDADWECMQSLSQFMRPEEFMYGQFLWMRRRRNLVFGFLASFWLGTIPLLHRTPMLMAGVIGVGGIAFPLLQADLRRCDTAWSGLWETLMRRARSARGEKG